jgi:hypothetical protein
VFSRYFYAVREEVGEGVCHRRVAGVCPFPSMNTKMCGDAGEAAWLSEPRSGGGL